MPAITRPGVPARGRRRRIADYDEKLARHRRAVHRLRRPRRHRDDLLVHAALREGARRGAQRAAAAPAPSREVWPNLRVLFGGGVSAAPYLPVIRDLVGRDDVTLVDTYNATEGGVYAASDFSGAPRHAHAAPPRHVLRVRPARGARDGRRPRASRSGRSSATGRTSIVVDDRRRASTRTTRRHRPLPSTSARSASSSWGGSRAACRSRRSSRPTSRSSAPSRTRSTPCPCTHARFRRRGRRGRRRHGEVALRALRRIPGRRGARETWRRSPPRSTKGCASENRVYREHRSGEVALLPPRVVPLARGGARALPRRGHARERPGKVPPHHRRRRRRSCFGSTRHVRATSSP